MMDAHSAFWVAFGVVAGIGCGLIVVVIIWAILAEIFG
jgi:hypothetical protein